MACAMKCAFFLLAFCISSRLSASAGLPRGAHTQLGRRDFPQGFTFGTASAAYQYEGASRLGGRGPSIWDTFSHKKGKVLGSANGNVAADEYHHYKEDIDIMSNLGFDAYRFSISWSRIFPEGRGKVNDVGIAYYNNLINGLIEKGIQPFVTLYHWDLPQGLENAYGGWLSPHVVEDFASYAETCFMHFGDRVKHWITFNEPNGFTVLGYDDGKFAPGRCSSWMGNCTSGNSATEPYIAAHNVLLSHAAAVEVYRKKYQEKQNGSLGITISLDGYTPLTNSTEDAAAAQRMRDFQLGWFLDPIMYGEYPSIMRELVGNRLPHFSEEQKLKLKGSWDFVGINHYTTSYVADVPSNPDPAHTDWHRDSKTNVTHERDGVPIGPRAASEWLYIVPSGMYYAVNYIKNKYGNPPVFITENGVDEYSNSSLTLKQALRDHTRVQFYKDYISYLVLAVREGANVRGYFAWSLLDNFEWTWGYTVRFGLYYVDFRTLKRYPKTSAHWFRKFLGRKKV